MSNNRRLKSPDVINKKTIDEIKEEKRLTTYKQPTKGVKFNQHERELIESAIISLRDATGQNITFSKVLRSLAYLLEEKDITGKLALIVENRIH